MDENADVFELPPRTTWMNIRDDLSSLDLGIYEARDLVKIGASLERDSFIAR